jgi:hypothetical protein
MKLYIDNATNTLVTSATNTATPTITLFKEDVLSVEIRFVESGAVVDIGTPQIRLALGKDGSLIAFADAWTKNGTGATAYWTGTFNLNTQQAEIVLAGLSSTQVTLEIEVRQGGQAGDGNVVVSGITNTGDGYIAGIMGWGNVSGTQWSDLNGTYIKTSVAVTPSAWNNNGMHTPVAGTYNYYLKDPISMGSPNSAWNGVAYFLAPNNRSGWGDPNNNSQTDPSVNYWRLLVGCDWPYTYFTNPSTNPNVFPTTGWVPVSASAPNGNEGSGNNGANYLPTYGGGFSVSVSSTGSIATKAQAVVTLKTDLINETDSQTDVGTIVAVGAQHIQATTNVHGIVDTAELIYSTNRDKVFQLLQGSQPNNGNAPYYKTIADGEKLSVQENSPQGAYTEIEPNRVAVRVGGASYFASKQRTTISGDGITFDQTYSRPTSNPVIKKIDHGSINVTAGKVITHTTPEDGDIQVSGGRAGSIELKGGNPLAPQNSDLSATGSNAGSIQLNGGSAGINGQEDNARGGQITSNGGTNPNQFTENDHNDYYDWADKEHRGGDINLSGGSDGSGGDIDTSNNGGSIYTSGFNGSGGAVSGGTINTSGGDAGAGGSINLSNSGGSITSVGEYDVSGGSINLSYAMVDGDKYSGGSINTSGGGSINTSNLGGSINTSGFYRASGGSINTSADATGNGGVGGSITTAGTNGANGGNINTSAGGNGDAGGHINTSGGYNGGVSAGGSINTSGGDSSGGSINTSDGGGSIDTRGTGSIQLGVAGTRTILNGSASGGNKTITLPNTTGTIALTNDSRFTDARTPTSHTHGNLTNDGKVGSTSNLPLITTTAGAITTGSFGTTANSFCQGNDSRLSDARTPASHTHGNITNDGKIAVSGEILGTSFVDSIDTLPNGTYPILQSSSYGVGGYVVLAGTGTFGTGRTLSGTGGSGYIVGSATYGSTFRVNITSVSGANLYANKPLITTQGGTIIASSFGITANSFCQGNDSRLSDSRTPTAHTHAISDVTGLQTALDGKVLTSDARLGSQTIFTLGGESKITFANSTSYLYGCMPTKAPQVSGAYLNALLKIFGNFTITGIAIHQYLPSATTATLTYQLVRITGASSLDALGSSIVVAGNNNLTTATSSLSVALNSGDSIGLILQLGSSGSVPTNANATTILANLYCVPR